MLVLFETSAGYGLFQVNDEGALKKSDDLSKLFSTPQDAKKRLTLRAFQKFDNTTEALSAATALVEGKMGKELKSFLKSSVVKKKLNDTLVVAEAKLGGDIKEKLGIQCLHDKMADELMRCLRQHRDTLLDGINEGDMNSMVLGLAHSLSRYKIKFSPDKVDVMIVQAISLLDDLDKELNTYAMRVKEWYGWHFPEMVKIISDNILYAKLVQLMGMRSKAAETNFSTLLPEELEATLKDAAQLSMGTEISDEDLLNIRSLCNQVVEIHEYREQLYEYLRNRMQAIAPNLSIMVGELVGARLIAHAGSLLSLAKYPASTVQILGAEKALFRALKTKHETPKYGLIYHASLVGQATPKNKGKVSRMVAAKTALATRVDALAEQVNTDVGISGRAKIEARMHVLEGTQAHSLGSKAPNKKIEKYDSTRSATTGQQRTPTGYNASADVKKDVKRKRDEPEEKKKTNGDSTPKKKGKKEAKEEEESKKTPKKDKKKDKKAEKRKREEEPKKDKKKDKKDKKDKKKRKVGA